MSQDVEIEGKKLEIVKYAFDRFYEGGFHATGKCETPPLGRRRKNGSIRFTTTLRRSRRGAEENIFAHVWHSICEFQPAITDARFYVLHIRQRQLRSAVG